MCSRQSAIPRMRSRCKQTKGSKMTAGAVAVPTIIPLKVSSGPKHVIDSATRIELRSATTDALIFYTLNGTRPDPYQRLGESHTHTYEASFTLHPGKVTIKALATSKDGLKQSSVVTKTFVVHETEEVCSDDEGASSREKDNLHLRSPSKPSLSAQLRHRLDFLSRTGTPILPPPPSPGVLEATMSKTTTPATSAHTSRPPTREKPKPVCLYCSMPRPSDPQYKYCTHCGSRLPPLPSSEATPPLQMALCPTCRAQMPPNTEKCLVCETPVIVPRLPPGIQAQGDIEGKALCLSCSTGNPPNVQACITCEQPLRSLPSVPPPPPSTSPPPPSLPTPTTMRPVSGSSFLMCGMCGRVNVSDARFCDWCGSKPEGSQVSVLCAACSTSNKWHSRHCYKCGGLIRAPQRPGVELDATMKMPTTVEMPRNAWIPVVVVDDKGPELVSRSTQTQGIFYPSSQTISKTKGTEFSQITIKASSRDRVPKLDTYSPGKGLWRMQVDHVCSHLKSYSLGSPTFQGSIGSPQMGKLAQATVEESGKEMNLHLTFHLKGENQHNGRLSRASIQSSTSLKSESTTILKASPIPHKKSTSKKPRSQKPAVTSTKPKLSVDTQQLISEVSASGLGRRETVEELVQQGADVNAVDKSGNPVLSLAAANGHLECIEVLIENGGSVDTTANSTGNTALHEAVLRGPLRIDCIEVLLSHGANARIKNKEGLNPCELAMKLRHDAIVTCFATYVGAGLLDKLCKVATKLDLVAT